VKELELNSGLGILAAGTHGRGMWELSLQDLLPRFRPTPVSVPVLAGTPFAIALTAPDDPETRSTDSAGTVFFAGTETEGKAPGTSPFAANEMGRVDGFWAALRAEGARTSWSRMPDRTFDLGLDPWTAGPGNDGW